jgi:release factor glutamine methyltransferase
VQRLEAEILLCHALGVDRSFLYANPELDIDRPRMEFYDSLLERRLAGEPVAYITGKREFWSLPLKVTPDVLIPRPETEMLVETVLDLIPARPGTRVADLGTGSGAVALAIASERPMWEIHATDQSEAAIRVAMENAVNLGLERVLFATGSWTDPLTGKFDVLVCNPPYIASGDPHLSKGDCRFEPKMALEAGEEGLDAIRTIARMARNHLVNGGWLIVEHGYDQGEDVAEIFSSYDLSEISTAKDLSGQDRVTRGRLIQL